MDLLILQPDSHDVRIRYFSQAYNSAYQNLYISISCLNIIVDESRLLYVFNELLSHCDYLKTNFLFDKETLEYTSKINKDYSEKILLVQDIESENAHLYILDHLQKYHFNLNNSVLIKLLLFRKNDKSFITLIADPLLLEQGNLSILCKFLSNCYVGNDNIKSLVYKLHQKISIRNLKRPLHLSDELLSNIHPIHLFSNTPATSERIEYSVFESILTKKSDGGFDDFSLVLAGVSILLHRYSGESCIHFLSSGFLKGTLPIVLELSGKDSYQSIIQKINSFKQSPLDLLDIAELIKNAQGGGNIDYDNLFDIMVNFETSSDVQTYAISNTAKLAFSLFISNNRIDLRITYRTDLFKSESITRLSHHLQSIINEVISNPELPIHKINLFSDQEYSSYINSFDKKHLEKTGNIIEVFEKRVLESPNQIALVGTNIQLSYNELNQFSNKVAHSLLSNSTSIKRGVVLLMERDAYSVISILGILKSGQFYVPVDPEIPMDRINFIVNDSDCSTIITQQKFSHLLEGFQTRNIVFIESIIESESADEVIFNPEIYVNPEELMYAIYTSGTTGAPKGVAIMHKTFINMIDDILYNDDNELSINSNDHISQFASHSFDVSVAEIFMTLLGGASLYIVPSDVRANPKQFVEFLIRNQISISVIPPSYLKILPRELVNLRIIITGGEKANYDDVKYYSQKSIYINSYGPTETTISVSYLKINPNSLTKNVSIGKPIKNVYMWVLDSNLNFMPIGCSGEIYIGGDALAKGYLNNPELTSEKFIINPHLPGEKIYKTGDIGYLDDDNNLYFIGRVDSQIKLNGFRIELSEIESILMQHQAVFDVAVRLVDTDGNNKHLTAYVVFTTSNIDNAINNIKSYLSDRLPFYMLPSHYIPISQIPLTLNGKTDFRKLSEFDAQTTTIYKTHKVPSTELELNIMNIWSDVLGIKNISTDDDFFRLGGSSIKAIQILNQINTFYNVSLDFKSIFLKPTIEHLANLVELVLLSRSEFKGSVQENDIEITI